MGCRPAFPVFQYERCPLHLDHHDTILIVPNMTEPDDALIRSGPGFAFFQNLGFYIQGIAVEHGMGMFDVLVAQIGHQRPIGQVGHGEADGP